MECERINNDSVDDQTIITGAYCVTKSKMAEEEQLRENEKVQIP